MKKLNTHPLFAAAVAGALVFGSLAYAQDTTGTTSTVTAPPASTGPSGPPPGGGHKHGEKMQHLAEALGLTDAQKEQLKPILKSEMEQMKALKDDATLTDKDAKKAKFKSIHQAADEQIKAILTPEQIEKWKEMKKERHEHGGPGAGPAPVTTGTNQ